MLQVSRDGFLGVLAEQLADPDSHWGLGGFGAIAEFCRDRDEAAAPGAPDMSLVTARGGIRIAGCAGARLVAYETAAGAGWNQTLSLCLPLDAAAMSRRAVLTEIGPDADALRAEDRDGILFDLGLSLPHVDAMVRVRDAETVARLRAHAGKSVFAPDSGAMGVILAANPHRVFVSRCGRVEVYQPIPPPDGRSPEGPHTHVLPKLLAHNRTHAATEPVPDGWAPCLSVFPAHPVKDAFGRATPFVAERHRAFQSLLDVYGDPAMTALKARVTQAVAAGEAPFADIGDDRFARACIRVALRQMQASGLRAPSLALCLEKYERHGAKEDGDMSGCH